MFLGIQLTAFHIGSYNGLLPTRQHAIIWTNDGQFADAYMYVSLSLNELSWKWTGDIYLGSRKLSY